MFVGESFELELFVCWFCSTPSPLTVDDVAVAQLAAPITKMIAAMHEHRNFKVILFVIILFFLLVNK